jgi:hypothetical protein
MMRTAILLLLAASPVVAQPAVPDPVAEYESLRRSYREGVLADRVVVRVVAKGRERRSTVVVRTAPKAASPRARVELGRLLLDATPTRLLATCRSEAATIFDRALDGPFPASLSGVLPPLPLPQLSWAFQDSGDELSPYLTAVEWTSTHAPDRQSLTLIGTAQGDDLQRREIRLTLDRRSGRPRALIANLAGDARLELAFSSIDAGKPEAWAIDARDRKTVPSLAELTTKRADFGPGDPLPSFTLLDAQLAPWSLAGSLKPEASSAPDKPPAAVLVFYRAEKAGASHPLHERDTQAALQAARELGAPLVRSIAVFGPEAFDPETLGARATEPEGPARLWSPNGLIALEQLDPDANVLLVALDHDRKILAMVEGDGRTSAECLSALRAALAK